MDIRKYFPSGQKESTPEPGSVKKACLLEGAPSILNLDGGDMHVTTDCDRNSNGSKRNSRQMQPISVVVEDTDSVNSSGTTFKAKSTDSGETSIISTPSINARSLQSKNGETDTKRSKDQLTEKHTGSLDGGLKGKKSKNGNLRSRKSVGVETVYADATILKPGEKIERIIDKWIGPSDVREHDIFYQVKYEGQPMPDEGDLWLHESQLWKYKDLVDTFNRTFKPKSAKRTARKRTSSMKPSTAERSNSTARGSNSRKKDSLAISRPSSSVAGCSKPKSVDKKSQDKPSKRKVGPKSAKNKLSAEEDEKPRGFDRGLDPEVILAAIKYEDVLLYYVKWQGIAEADLCLAIDCRVRCPELIIDYCQLNVQIVET